MYKQSSVDAVKAAPIEQVIGNILTLKKQGVNYFTKSPFSEDRTASFCVFPATNTFKCFSSGIGGDAIKFVMTHKNVSFPEAIKIIADICRIVLEEEEVSEEETRKRSYRQELFDLNSLAVTKYQMKLANVPPDHWAKRMVADRGFSDEILSAFYIGYAPAEWKFLTDPFIERAKFEQAITAGLVTSKDGKNYDYFRDKLIFPIQDAGGNFIGFGGRDKSLVKYENFDAFPKPGNPDVYCQSNEEGKTYAWTGTEYKELGKYAKYVNSRNSEIYNKDHVLYGLYQAKPHIQKERTAILVEGYTDVTGLHQHDCRLAVASCGTALGKEQCKVLRRFAAHVIIFRDNDGYSATGELQKGALAAMRDVNILLSEGFKVSVCIPPVGEDPDSMAQKTENIKQYVFDNAQDAIEWKATLIKNRAANDPDAMSAAVDEVAEMLSKIGDDMKLEHYLKSCAAILKKPVTVKMIKERMKMFIAKVEEKITNGKPQKSDFDMIGLPEGADMLEFQKKGFVTHNNKIWFQGSNKFFPGTNWRLTPLFHVQGNKKRICEITHELGSKKLVEFSDEDFVNMTKFECKLLDIGSFYFTPDANGRHFKMIRNVFLNDFQPIKEIATLGWNSKGFYAFSDCIWHQGETKKANAYGIVQLAIEKEELEYIDDINHFYLPSASAMHNKTDGQADLYENDRALVYRKAPCTIRQWMEQLVKVYGKKANIGIAVVIASCFRDLFINRYGFFPILFLTGEKGSGKSVFGQSLTAFFFYKMQPFDLNSGTPVAFFRRLDRMMNVLDMFEEFHDRVDDKIFQGCKGGFDGRGREMGKATGDNRTQTTKVNSAMMITSQYLSGRDDNSLTTRSILGHFTKPVDSYTTEEIENMSILKAWEDAGINSLVVEVIQHRAMMEEKVHKTYSDIAQKLKKELKGFDYQERMLNNYVLLLTPLVILEDVIRFPFKISEVWQQFKDAILDSSDLIIESEGLAEFWRMLEFLLDSGRIKTGKEFIVKKLPSVSIQGKKGEKPTEVKFEAPKNILFLRLPAVHPMYHKEVSMRDGMDVIGENTLKNYFRSKKYFVGLVKSMRFDDTATSAYAFDYDLMHGQGILNLSRGADLGEFEVAGAETSAVAGDDDLPEWLQESKN